MGWSRLSWVSLGIFRDSDEHPHDIGQDYLPGNYIDTLYIYRIIFTGVIDMGKKNTIVAAILGFFILGLFYSTGLNKKGVISVLGLMVVSWVVANFVSAELAAIVNVAGAYLGYRWASEHNAEIDGGTPA